MKNIIILFTLIVLSTIKLKLCYYIYFFYLHYLKELKKNVSTNEITRIIST